MRTCIRLRKALVIETGNQSTNCWFTNQWPRIPEADVSIWLWHGLTITNPMIQCFTWYWNVWGFIRLTQVSNLYKATNIALEDSLIRKFKKFCLHHHQMRYISIRCPVTLAALYHAQPDERPARQKCQWIQVQRWYHYQPLSLHGQIKQYAKNKQDNDSLILLTRVFSSDISMAFGLTKCGCLIVIRGKIKSTSGISR